MPKTTPLSSSLFVFCRAHGETSPLFHELTKCQHYYTAAGDVLMGTARWQKEAAEKTEQERILAEVEHKRSEVALARAELTARIEALEQELKQKEAEAERLNGADARRKLDLAKRRKELEHSPSAKIFKKRPDNSQGAGKRTPGRRSPKAGGQ